MSPPSAERTNEGPGSENQRPQDSPCHLAARPLNGPYIAVPREASPAPPPADSTTMASGSAAAAATPEAQVVSAAAASGGSEAPGAPTCHITGGLLECSPPPRPQQLVGAAGYDSGASHRPSRGCEGRDRQLAGDEPHSLSLPQQLSGNGQSHPPSCGSGSGVVSSEEQSRPSEEPLRWVVCSPHAAPGPGMNPILEPAYGQTAAMMTSAATPPPPPPRPGTPSGSPPGSARSCGSAGHSKTQTHTVPYSVPNVTGTAVVAAPGSPPSSHAVAMQCDAPSPPRLLFSPVGTRRALPQGSGLAPEQQQQQQRRRSSGAGNNSGAGHGGTEGVCSGSGGLGGSAVPGHPHQVRGALPKGALPMDVPPAPQQHQHPQRLEPESGALSHQAQQQQQHVHYQQQQHPKQPQQLLQQHEQHQLQQQSAIASAAVAAAAAGLPVLPDRMPTAAISYTPWGPVLPVVQVPASGGVLVPGGGLELSAYAAAAGGMLPSSPAAAAAAAGASHQVAAVMQLAAAAAAVTAAAAAAAPAAALTSALSSGTAAQPPAPPAEPALPPPSAAEAEALAGQFRLAAVLRSAGKAAEALSLLDGVLVRQPGHVKALHMQAECQQTVGQVQEAIATHLRTLSLAPSHTPSLTALGALYQSQGLLGEAVAAYRRAYELRPDDPAIREGLAVVLTDQGTKLKNAGAPVFEAVARYQAASSLCPAYAPALYNLGVVAGELRQTEAAVEYYRAAIAAEPRYAQAHCNLGVLLRERGRLAEAVTAYEAALAAAPNFSIVRNNLAIALTDLGTHVKNEGRLDDGILLYERALSYAPRHADALYNLGVAYGEKGDLQRAAFMYEMALAFNPACAEAHNNLGVIWKEQDNIERAVECYTAALTIRPNFPQSLNNLGVVMTAQGRAAEALALLAAAVAASPTYTEAHNNLGVLQRDVGCIPEALASYSRCLELDPHCRNAGQNRLLALNYIHPGEDDIVSSAHREWGERFQANIRPMPPLGPADRSWDPDRPLRIGYISPDLFTHSVSYFAEAPLTHHSPGRGYQHFVYSCVPKPDAKTSRLRAATEAAGGVWRDVLRLSEAELAELVRQDEIDLLVELTGHTANNRLGVMAQRPAPVQLTWIGYPNSTGLRAVDYRLTDEICDPWDTTQTFVEELVRLPGCFLCYTPAADAPRVAPPPALANGYITFGSFNNLAKITPQVLGLWGAILARVPRSRLVLKNKPFACEAARVHVLRQLAAVGVEGWRVDLLPLAPGNAQHLATYALMDISLDPFPYAGTTTTTESLFMGVPCLTLAGRCHAHNVGASLLTAVGLHPHPSAHPGAHTHNQDHNKHLQARFKSPPRHGHGQHSPASGPQTPSPTAHLGGDGLSAGPTAAAAAAGAVGGAGSDGCSGPSAAAHTNLGANSSLSGNWSPGSGVGGADGDRDSPQSPASPSQPGGSGSACGGAAPGSGSGRPWPPCRWGWVASTEAEYVELAVAHASDVQALADLRATLRDRMLSSPMCDGPTFLRRLEDVYRGLWRRHCADKAGDLHAAAAAGACLGLGRRRQSSGGGGAGAVQGGNRCDAN